MLRLIVNRIAYTADTYTHARLPGFMKLKSTMNSSIRRAIREFHCSHSTQYVHKYLYAREIYDGNGEPTRSDPIRDSTQLNAIEIVYYSYIRNNKIEQILFIRIVYHSAHVDQS